MEIFPSLISADILNLEKVIKSLDPHCNGYHIDVMDDHFVPNLTWGPMFVNSISKITNLPLHVHLMVDNPSVWIDRVLLDEKDIFIFHIEAFNDSERMENLIQDVKNKGWKVGIALNPKTDIKLVFDYLKDLDHVLIMSVEPGFSGQKFIQKVLLKIEPLIKKREELNLAFKIGMDGGIGSENIKELSEMGIDQFGIASVIFSKKDIIKALQELM